MFLLLNQQPRHEQERTHGRKYRQNDRERYPERGQDLYPRPVDVPGELQTNEQEDEQTAKADTACACCTQVL